MVHHRERLTLSLEPGDDLLGIHSGLDELQRDLTTDRLRLLRQPNLTHAAFANAFEQTVWPDGRTTAACSGVRVRHIWRWSRAILAIVVVAHETASEAELPRPRNPLQSYNRFGGQSSC
jgi:hypothetical protein